MTGTVVAVVRGMAEEGPGGGGRPRTPKPEAVTQTQHPHDTVVVVRTAGSWLCVVREWLLSRSCFLCGWWCGAKAHKHTTPSSSTPQKHVGMRAQDWSDEKRRWCWDRTPFVFPILTAPLSHLVPLPHRRDESSQQDHVTSKQEKNYPDTN